MSVPGFSLAKAISSCTVFAGELRVRDEDLRQRTRQCRSARSRVAVSKLSFEKIAGLIVCDDSVNSTV